MISKNNSEIKDAVLNSKEKPQLPLTTKLAFEIPKPLDWQAFQRQCVVLFREELNDPHTQEYGRAGQKQGGIDILGRRNGHPDHFVGIQCRKCAKPLKQDKLLADAREALALEVGLRELIFATTAPDDTAATDAAFTVERLLRAEGYNLTVALYGWGQLQQLICRHEAAYSAFHPATVATHALKAPEPHTFPDWAGLLSTKVVEQLRAAGLAVRPQDTSGREPSDEDPALHARIDTFRDLNKDQQLTLQADQGLRRLLEREDLTNKPYARFRIESNLGSLAMDLGREAEAVARFEAAYALRRDDPKAIANLALARTIQGRYAEAMDTARAALNSEPRADYALAYLLQAAARSDWVGDPETLIPANLVASLPADIGLAEYLRRRDVPGWATRTLELARRHPDAPDLIRARGIAILSLAIESGSIIPGGFGPVTANELNRAADDLKAVAEHNLEVAFADRHDLVAYVNNAAVLLRLCERYAESERLLLAALPLAGDEPQLRRLCAFVQSAQDRAAEALALLAGDSDPENQIFRAELRATQGELPEALKEILAVDEKQLDDRLRGIRWRLIGEVALRLGDDEQLAAAVRGLRDYDPNDVSASLLEIRGGRKQIEDTPRTQERMRALAAAVPADLAMLPRYQLADELRNQDLPDAAAELLEGHVDLERPSPATELYLQSLAQSRRDEAFSAALAQAAPAVRYSISTRWTEATHAWNMDDLPASLAAVDAILVERPNDARARLLKLEILVRQNKSPAIFAELDKPIEKLDWRDPQNLYRLASLLGHFGYVDRAAALAYRLFLDHRDQSRAWMTLSMLVLDKVRGDGEAPSRWAIAEVGPDAAVRLRYADGSEIFFVIEPDAALRKLDPDSWEPSHALVRCLTGQRIGAAFTGPDGRDGAIIQIIHKYIARLHYVMENHASRFPEIFGFRSFNVDFESPNGLDNLISRLKERHDWVTEEEERYTNGLLPLGLLGDRIGVDTIEVGVGLATHGTSLKVAAGNALERDAAVAAVRDGGRRGCVLDLLAFWTCWRVGALDAVAATCGPLRVPRSLVDRMRARREKLGDAATHGHRSTGYLEGGRINITELPAEAFANLIEDVDQAIAWLEANAEISPIVIGDAIPAEMRDFLRQRRTDAFDSAALAVQSGILLVTDDLPTRELQRNLTGIGSTWLHVVFGIAHEQAYIDTDNYVRWTAWLMGAGHSYLGVNGTTLSHAARLDGPVSTKPGPLFTMLSRGIGGPHAEPLSHVNACVGCLRDLWGDPRTAPFRQPVTGHLLRQMLRGRQTDYAILLRTLLAWSRGLPELERYIRDWMIGHFVGSIH